MGSYSFFYHLANDLTSQQSKNTEALQGKLQPTNTGDIIHLPQRGTKQKLVWTINT